VSSPESMFPIEYVTGPIQLPPWDASVYGIAVWISVLNVGDVPAATRALGYRSSAFANSTSPYEGDMPSTQLFDSGDAEVAPTAQRLMRWDGWDAVVETGQYWVKVLATSSALVPSVEFVEFKPQDDPGPGDVLCRYLAADFAVFHHRVRYVPQPVPIGPALE
jgi:hypothetical protein